MLYSLPSLHVTTQGKAFSPTPGPALTRPPPTIQAPPSASTFCNLPLYHVSSNSLALCSPMECKATWGWGDRQSPFHTIPPPPSLWGPPSGSMSRAQKDLLIQRLQVSFMVLGKFRVSNHGEPVTSKRWWFFDSAPAFLNIMFLNKVNGYSREIAKGRSQSRARLDKSNKQWGQNRKAESMLQTSCLFVFPLRSCSYKQWAHLKGCVFF